jgi:hypothetical protein
MLATRAAGASDELLGLQSHDLLFITVSIVTPSERNLPILSVYDTVIADGDPVSISAQILKDSLSTAERRLAIDNPLLVVERTSEPLEGTGLHEVTDTAGEDKSTRFKAGFQMVQKLVFE